MKKSSHLLPYIGRYCLLLPLLLGLAACASESDEVTGAWVEEYGDPPRFLDPVAEPESSKEDGIGVAGPKTSWDSSDYAVWTPTQLWTKVTPEAGLAWPANSGLTWEGKYSAWVASLEKIPAVNGYTTFQLTNPQGKTLPAPALECAEVAIFLRATFAAWYRLPFFMEARDARGRLFLGHFGFRRADGTIYASSPKYKTLYKDYTATWRAGQAWPSDTRLASRGLYGGGDEMTFLPDVNGKPALAGAYFDQLFLDKRVGHYLLSALGWFGSMHLADSANMYHLKPEAMRAGDVLLERFQSSGIGHTIPVMRVKLLESQRREVAIATGSMPRRQPVWEEGNGVTYYFTNAMMGGPGTNGDGEAYAALGGGLRRWRTPLNTGAGTYRNSVLEVDQNSWINSTNLEAIAARCAQFEELLGEMSPATKRDLALGRISVAREALVQHPSSCTSRTRREDAFKDLYRVMSEDFGMSKAQVDSRYRIFADYVLAELEYNKSRSCCWNSTTPAMYDIIMLFNEDLQQQAELVGLCAGQRRVDLPEVAVAAVDRHRLAAVAVVRDRGVLPPRRARAVPAHGLAGDEQLDVLVDDDVETRGGRALPAVEGRRGAEHLGFRWNGELVARQLELGAHRRRREVAHGSLVRVARRREVEVAEGLRAAGAAGAGGRWSRPGSPGGPLGRCFRVGVSRALGLGLDHEPRAVDAEPGLYAFPGRASLPEGSFLAAATRRAVGPWRQIEEQRVSPAARPLRAAAVALGAPQALASKGALAVLRVEARRERQRARDGGEQHRRHRARAAAGGRLSCGSHGHRPPARPLSPPRRG